MLSTREASKSEPTKDIGRASRARGGDVVARGEPESPMRTDLEAVRDLLGSAPVPASPQHRRPWRQLGNALVVILVILAFSSPGYLWYQQRSRYVTSENAAVRGHVADIGTRFSGRLSAVSVRVGDRVKAGQILARLEDRHLQADVEEASAAVASLERMIEVERVRLELERREIEFQRPEVKARIKAAEALAEAARLQAEDARKVHELQQMLYSRRELVPGEEVRKAEYRWRLAEARLVEARANAQVAVRAADREARRIGALLAVRERQIKVLEARLCAARAHLARTRTDLADAAIRAPEDGAIVRRIVQPGGAVEVGQPILSMLLGRELWIETWIHEEDLGAVRLGSRATVTFQPLPDREFEGTVARIGLVTDLEIPEAEVPRPRFARMRGTPVVGVQVRLRHSPPWLVPGLSALVTVERVPAGCGAAPGTGAGRGQSQRRRAEDR